VKLAAMRRRQVGAVMRLELRKSLLGRRALWIYLLALAPAVITALHSARALVTGQGDSLDGDTEILAGIIQFYYLRVGMFFAALGVFTRLFRGDMMERSLHYTLLTPMRREVLACGKFAAGVVTMVLIFGIAVLACFAGTYLHHGRDAQDFIFARGGLGHLGAYLLVVVLASVGYGALFLLLGLVARNPVLPALGVLTWESINRLLPAALKPLSVIFYLEPLLPIDVPTTGIAALFAIPAEPISPWLAVPGLLVVSALVLAAACLRARSTEIAYGGD
jgi:ABC-type transport system involved in multi-copper enzyme maturation permease subunit